MERGNEKIWAERGNEKAPYGNEKAPRGNENSTGFRSRGVKTAKKKIFFILLRLNNSVKWRRLQWG